MCEKTKPKERLSEFREGAAARRVSITWLSFTFDTTRQSRQYLTPAIVSEGYDLDEPTADITMVAHTNFIFDPLDGSASPGTPNRSPLTLT